MNRNLLAIYRFYEYLAQKHKSCLCELLAHVIRPGDRRVALAGITSPLALKTLPQTSTP